MTVRSRTTRPPYRRGTVLIVAIGVLMAAILLLRPRGMLGEEVTVSRHLDIDAET